MQDLAWYFLITCSWFGPAVVTPGILNLHFWIVA